MKTCDCKLWDKNIDAYNDMYFFVEKYHGPSYQGKEYDFCPWCGKELQEEEYEEEYEDEYDEEDEEDEDVIDTTPMHGDEEEDDDEEEESGDWDYDFELVPEEMSYPTLSEGWVSQN